MTTKQELFIVEYLKDLNATQAAIRAGYSKKCAAEIGRQNLIKLDIKKAIEDKKENSISNIDAMIAKNIAVAESIRDSKLEKASDRLKAVELLGKYSGMFTEKIDIKGSVVPPNVNITYVRADDKRPES